MQRALSRALFAQQPCLRQPVTTTLLRTDAPMLWSALLLLGAAEFAPDFRADSPLYQAQIRAALFDRTGFDRILPPTSNRSALGDDYSASGTTVEMQIRVFKVQSVNAAEGWMRLKIWMRQTWVDTRLSWDPSDFGGVTTTYFQADQIVGGEQNEIWIPDFQPYNANQGLVHTLEPALARVSSDGSVFYSRPGSMDVMCKFSGLVAFPFDKLTCPIEIAGWGFSGGHQGLTLKPGDGTAMTGDGFQFSDQELTSGSSYQEYTISAISASLETYTYECCPSEPWPIALYRVTLSRSDFFYVPVSILPGIVVTLLSFAVFWTDTGSADALGYGISIIIVNLLLNVVLITLLPVCGELIWIDLFATINTAFCCISLFQSAFNIMLENKQDDSLLPTWVTGLYAHLTGAYLKAGLPDVKAGGARFLKVAPHRSAEEASEQAKEQAKELKRRGTFVANDLMTADYLNESIAGVLYRQQTGERRKLVKTGGPPASATPEEKAKKLTNFERLFFILDTDCSLFIDACGARSRSMSSRTAELPSGRHRCPQGGVRDAAVVRGARHRPS